jgi:hypothetical protein
MASSRNQHERDPVEEATSRAEKRNESQHSIPKGAKREKETDRFRCACSDDDASKKKTQARTLHSPPPPKKKTRNRVPLPPPRAARPSRAPRLCEEGAQPEGRGGAASDGRRRPSPAALVGRRGGRLCSSCCSFLRRDRRRRARLGGHRRLHVQAGGDVYGKGGRREMSLL